MSRLARTALLVALAVASSGCFGAEPMVVTAEFDEVASLVPGSSVQLADVRVGQVDATELTDDYRARVTMTVKPDLDLPSEVDAVLRKTNVLGERFVELMPDRDSGGSFDPSETITDTRVQPDLEEVVRSGTQVLAVVATDTIAAALQAGALGLGDGRGAVLSQLLDDLAAVTGRYEAHTDDLVALIDGLGAFLEDTAPRAELHQAALEESARTAAVLRRQDERLLDTLADLRGLALTSTDLIRTHRGRIDAETERLATVLAEIERRDGDIPELLASLNAHNYSTIRGVNAEHAQVLNDLIFCGFNDEPGDNVRACDDPPQGRPEPQPRVGPDEPASP